MGGRSAESGMTGGIKGLAYGKLDSALSAEQRRRVTEWEARRVNNDIEFAYAVDRYGAPVGDELRGGGNSTRIPSSYMQEGMILTHNHPDGGNTMGGTFSPADLYAFSNRPFATMRATAKEGTYSISKTPSFDAAGFERFSARVAEKATAKHSGKISDLGNQYKNGKLTWEQYDRLWNRENEAIFKEMHREYLKGQKTYGYTYTLERR